MKTIAVRPSATIDLSHRATMFASAPMQSLIVVAGDYGDLSILENDVVVAQFPGFPNTHGIAVHPLKPLIAIVHGDTNPLSIIDTQGEIVLGPQAIPSNVEPYRWGVRGGGACYFEPQGDFLWSAAALSSDQIEVQVRDCNSWQVIHQIVIEDPIGECYLAFHPTSDPMKITLWLAGGQDGQMLYWLTRTADGISWTLEPRVDDMSPPVFVPSGNQFVVADMGSIALYKFPEGQEIETTFLPWDEEEGFGGFVAPLDDVHVLIDTSNGILFVIEINQMTLVGEVTVEGHEPKPAEEIYPRLKGDTGLCSELAYHACVGDRIIAGYRRDAGVDLKDWQTTLLSLEMQDVRRSLMD